MTASDYRQGPDWGRIVAGVFVAVVFVVLAGLLVYYLVRPDPGGSAAQPLPAPSPTAQPQSSEPAPTDPAPDSEPAPDPEPTELPTGDLAPGTTAIFHGQPATGPWQAIGSISEITAEGAGPVATMAFDQHWEPYGLPDELWDLLVATVSLEAVELGPPLERPPLNASAGAELLNGGGGVSWTDDDTEGRGIVVSMEAIYEDDGRAVWPRWAFLIHPDTHQVLAARPRVEISEGDVDSFQEAGDRLSEAIWDWVMEQPVLHDR